MIKAINITKSYGAQALFEDVSFTLGRGERVGLVGRNGSGKTTLFRMILGQEEMDSGEFAMPRNYRIAHLSQHISFSEPTVISEACTGIKASEDGTDESYRAEAILMGLGFSRDDLDSDPRMLSGGFQIRLNLAKALVSAPDLLLLDEPTNYLDIVSVRWLKGFLKGWKGELMLITHDREFMDSVVTHTMAIHRGRVKKLEGPTWKLYARIAEEEEIYEKTRLNNEKKKAEVEKFINRFRAKATKASAVQSRIKALDKMDDMDELAELPELDFSFNSAPFPGKWLLEAEGLSFGFDGNDLLIDGLKFAVGKKDRIGVIGKNGKGKTTLLNLVAGELSPLKGAVSRHANLKLAYFGQTNIERLNLSNTIELEIMEAHPDYSRGEARKICGAMMFSGDSALKKISVLSGGERARVLLGKLLVSPANMLLLDEPTNHLDMESIDSLVDAINAFNGAVMIVTHSEMILDSFANRLIIFDGGRVSLFEGTYRDFLEKVGWESESVEAARAVTRREKEVRGGNRKELRRLRAEVLEEKKKTLGPVKRRMDEIEGEIIKFEKAAEESNGELLAASERGDGAAIISFSRAYHESQRKIDSLFDELAELSSKQEAVEKEFEAKLKELE